MSADTNSPHIAQIVVWWLTGVSIVVGGAWTVYTYTRSGSDPPPPAKAISPTEFESRLTAYRSDHFDMIAKLFVPADPATRKHKIQVAIVEAVLSDEDFHTRCARTVDGITTLINLGMISRSIPGLADVPGPNDTSADAWIQSLENNDVSITINGETHEQSLRWWFIYSAVRRSLNDARFTMAIRAARAFTFLGGNATKAYFTLLQNEGIRNKLTERVETNYSRQVGVDDHIVVCYQQWYDERNEDRTSYSHSEFVASLSTGA